MIKVGIVGSAGYTAGELIRILLQHPAVEIEFAHSSSNAGNVVSTVHSDLIGETGLKFTDELKTNVDVVFLCSGHGASKQFLASNPFPNHVKIIDLSTDFRIKATDNEFVYGLPEAFFDSIQTARKIANPGCFATNIQLALLPLVAHQLLTDDIHIHAITGSTGAGQNPTAHSHFSWRNNNVSTYKPFEHQHLAEIRQTLVQLQDSYDKELNFIPIRGNFSRGIYSTIYTKCSLSADEVKDLYINFYEYHPFTIVSDVEPDLKFVVNTNKCVLNVQKHKDKILIISVIDNLLKGASGQAVQNMNIMFGLPQKQGLKLKGVAF